jgi:endoglucanase
MAATNAGFLKVNGRQIVNGAGAEVRLRGFAFAGWLNFENFMTGMPGHESGLRKVVAQIAGDKKAARFFDGFLDHFISEYDFELMHSLGCNLVRIPFNYHHFESDERPFTYQPEGFTRFDQAIAWARKHGVYLILDLHAAQGAQNRHFFADHLCPAPHLWEQPQFQDRACALWQEIARRYAQEPVIAGYDILNEPIPEDVGQLNRFYRQAVAAIRAVDPNHVLFIEGEGYSTRFGGLEFPFDPNAVYSNHFYSPCGMEVVDYPGTWSWDGKHYDRAVLQHEYQERTAYMREKKVPNWFGEFSITFTPRVSLESRLRYLADMLAIAEEAGDSWSFGIYKDLGVTGMLHVRPDSAWMRRTAALRQVVDDFRCSPFGSNSTRNRFDEICLELGHLAKERLAPLGETASVEDLKNLLKFHLSELALSRQLQPLFAKLLADLSETEIDELARSFDSRNCTPCRGWMDAIRKVTGAR